MLDEEARKPVKSNVFVRVRPFSDAEAMVCPEDSPVPREIITWDGVYSLTVLDAANGFHPRRNGKFDVSNVLWSFRDEEKPKVVVHTQQDVYTAVITPMIPHIINGYSTAFCVAGGPGSGRLYTLYGDNVNGINRGLMPRFVENIFNAFKRQKRENTVFSCEIEAIEISPTDTYTDLLLQKRRGVPLPTEELRIVHDQLEGVRLQGATRLPVKTSSDAIGVLQQIARVVPKHNRCHTVCFHFVETFRFADPDDPERTVTKSRYIKVLFVLLRNTPAAFQRCIDVAVEHDSGENPMAKVPTRETALTRLYPELLQQGYNLSFVCCVSPFYEHVRETMATLTLATKFMKLKCKPKLLEDEALNELRNLSEEVKCLKSEVVKQAESTEIVQKELNVREMELMKREAIYKDCKSKLAKREEAAKMAISALKLNRLRTRWHRKNFDDQCRKKAALMAAMREKIKIEEKSAVDVLAALEEKNRRINDLELQIKDRKNKNLIYESNIKEWENKKEKLEKMKNFIAALPEERIHLLNAEQAAKTRQLIADNNMKAELLNFEEIRDKAYARCRELSKDYEAAYAASQGTRDKIQLMSDVERLTKEIEQVEANIKCLESDLNNRKGGCHCSLM